MLKELTGRYLCLNESAERERTQVKDRYGYLDCLRSCQYCPSFRNTGLPARCIIGGKSSGGTLNQLTTGEYLKRLLLTVLVVLVAILLWRASGIFLLAFVGVLLATFLRTLADFLNRRSPLSASQSLAVVVLSLSILLGGSGWLLVPRIASQTAQLTNEVSEAFNRLEARLVQAEWGQTLLTDSFFRPVFG